MDVPEPRHLFVVPEDATWFDVAVLSAASRLACTPSRELSPVGRELKDRLRGSREPSRRA